MYPHHGDFNNEDYLYHVRAADGEARRDIAHLEAEVARLRQSLEILVESLEGRGEEDETDYDPSECRILAWLAVTPDGGLTLLPPRD